MFRADGATSAVSDKDGAYPATSAIVNRRSCIMRLGIECGGPISVSQMAAFAARPSPPDALATVYF